jgi:hypothetical protein
MNKLRMNTNFMILGAMVQKLWVFKFLGKFWVGRACARANQEEMISCGKKGGQEK